MATNCAAELAKEQARKQSPRSRRLPFSGLPTKEKPRRRWGQGGAFNGRFASEG